VRSGERHEKDDRHRVDDPRRWVLGWINERKVAALRAELAELDAERAAAVTELADIGGQREVLQARLDALLRVEGFRSWGELDHHEAESRADAFEEQNVSGCSPARRAWMKSPGPWTKTRDRPASCRS
jgi:uncharacterized protein YPO0396